MNLHEYWFSSILKLFDDDWRKFETRSKLKQVDLCTSQGFGRGRGAKKEAGKASRERGLPGVCVCRQTQADAAAVDDDDDDDDQAYQAQLEKQVHGL